MTDSGAISKFSALPAHLQAQAADFIGYLWQKATRTPAPPADALPAGPVTNPPHPAPPLYADDVEVLDPLLSDGTPRLSLARGAGKHFIAYIAEDFDAPMEEFKDYM